MPYKINERLTDTRITARGQNLEQLFTDMFLAMMYTIKPTQKFAPEKTEREVSFESLDTTALLVDFLNEILSLSRVNKESYNNIIFYKIKPTGLRAKLFGVSVESFHRNIGAITYHDAEVGQTKDEVWEAKISLAR